MKQCNERFVKDLIVLGHQKVLLMDVHTTLVKTYICRKTILVLFSNYSFK